MSVLGGTWSGFQPHRRSVVYRHDEPLVVMGLVPLVQHHVIGGNQVSEVSWRIGVRAILIRNLARPCLHSFGELTRFAAWVDWEMCEVMFLGRRVKFGDRTQDGGSRRNSYGGLLLRTLKDYLGYVIAELDRIRLCKFGSPNHRILPAGIRSLRHGLRLATTLINQIEHIVWALDRT